MSKKRLRSRIDDLFADLAGEELLPAQPAQPEGKSSPGSSGTAPGPAGDPAELLSRLEAVLNQPLPRLNENRPAAPSGSSAAYKGFAFKEGSLQTATDIWTQVGSSSLQRNEPAMSSASRDIPAAMAVPMRMQGVGDLLLEIVDDTSSREWTEDDRFLVMEVATQLALALDNAQLYMSVQQELAERIRAEQTTLRRNKDLATLNQVGQQLSRLTTRSEIFELLASMISEVLNTNNLYISVPSANQKSLSFPVYLGNGKPVEMPGQAFGNGVAEYVITNQQVMLIPENVAGALAKKGIDAPDPVSASLLAIPLVTGSRAIGAVVVQDFTKEKAFDSISAELLSTAAAQATTALENADLFLQMQTAFQAIETRERYQANVARSAAILTEFGTKSMPEVLKALGQATQCSRIYFARLQEDERGVYWSAAAEWIDPGLAYLFDKARIQRIPVNDYLNWASSLRDRGWIVTQASEEQTPESAFLDHQHIRSSLLLAVPGQSPYPNFIAFEQFDSTRIWQSDEINALRVAADAVANTFVREGLLEQLQGTLEETEGLYQASNRLALANDMQEMVSAVLSGMKAANINRAVLALFEFDAYDKITQISVGANWYSGRGAPPPPVGTAYAHAQFERFLQTPAPVFYENVIEEPIDQALKEALRAENIRALAVFPLWSGKRQIGVLLLQSETSRQFSGRERRTYPPLVDQMAIAVENQRLFEQTQLALSETELLYNVANGISQAASVQDMLAAVARSLLPSGAEHVSLIMIDSDENGKLTGFEIIGAQDTQGEYHPIGAHYPAASLPLIKSLTDEPLIITDIHKHALDPASRSTFEQFEVAAGCLVPLRTGGQLIGLLNASATRPVEFAREDIRLLRVVGSSIAVALEKQRLLRQAQRRALELQTASEIARDTASTLSLDILLPRIVEMMRDRFGFYHASIFLLDDLGKYAVVRESTGEAGREMKQRGHRLQVGSRSVVGTATATSEPFILNDVTQSQMYYPNPLLPETRSEMGVPLKLGTAVIGALDLQSREINAFDQDDVTVLQILADQVAIAIENARAYELSQKAIADMKEIDRVKSQFLANMSHELRTPLNSIIGFSRVILKGIDGPINEIQSQDLSAIYNSGQHLLSLINDILDLSKIEAGKMELAFSEVHLADMINSAMSTAVGLVKDKPIKLHTKIPETLPPVQIDNTRIRQVLINFLSNAAKFTDEGSITVEALLSSSPTGAPEVMITVSDTGTGIAPEDQGKLFLPFSQVDDSATRKTGGTGLGLSICRSLIELHGGRIGLLRSGANQGSTFFFTMPLHETKAADVTETEDLNSNVILSIDDDLKVIHLYERYLKPHGYNIIPLSDPKQAVKRVKEIKPFAVTLDILMPGKDGWQVMQEIRSCPETRDTPIIICSILENQEKGFSMGAADYLVKPFLQEEMLNAISRLNRDGQISEVLVVDDDPEDLRLVKKMLEEKRQFHVTIVQGGVTGWKTIQTNRPDIIILDLFMPDMNGFEILKNMRADPGLRHTPVIILSGADLTVEQHQYLTDFGQSVQAKGYLRENELLVLLEEALRKFHPRQKK